MIHARSSPDTLPSSSIDRTTYVRAFAWLVLLLLGGLQAWAYRHAGSGPDSISYLDVADTYARAGWWAGINGCWSPLYSWLLIPLLHWVRPAPASEMAAVHALNFGVYVLALLAFELLLRELFLSCTSMRNASGRERALWRGVAYGAFAWGCLHLVSPALVTPDLLVAALTYLLTALVLRARRDGGRPWTLLAVGIVAGLAFLGKSAMFPVGLVTIAVAASGAWRDGGWRGAARAAAIALLAFGVISAPFVASLSVVKHRATFGDAGALNYAWLVNGVRPYTHWQGRDGFGTPVHPARQVLPDPPVYAFAGPLPGSYPLWYDPSYWYEGVRPRPGVAATALMAVRNLGRLAVRTAGITLPLGILLAGLHALGWLRPARWEEWMAFLPAAATLGLYAMVYLIDRYVGAHLSILLIAVLAGSLPTRRAPRWITRGMLYAAGAVLVANLAWWQAGTATLAARGGVPNMGWEVAREIHAVGVPKGARVGVVGSGLTAFWVRAARIRIVAEAPDAPRFWAAPLDEQARVLAALRAAGASAVVADNAPGCGRRPGWRPLGWNSCAWVGTPGQAQALPSADPPPTPGASPETDVRCSPAADASEEHLPAHRSCGNRITPASLLRLTAQPSGSGQSSGGRVGNIKSDARP